MMSAPSIFYILFPEIELLPASGRGHACLGLSVGSQEMFADQNSKVTPFQPRQELSRTQSLSLETPIRTDIKLKDTSALLQLVAHLSIMRALPITAPWDFWLWGQNSIHHDETVIVQSAGEWVTPNAVVKSSTQNLGAELSESVSFCIFKDSQR